jgi:hypothetical protein
MDLHSHVAELFPGDKRVLQRILLHALIDLGQVTKLECAWENCALPNTSLKPAGKRGACVTFDHTVDRMSGGPDHWRNILLMHHTCNTRKGAVFTPERRAKISAKVRERWQDPAYAQRVIDKSAEVLRTNGSSQRKSEAMKRHWADPERKAAHAAKLSRGESWRKARGL